MTSLKICGVQNTKDDVHRVSDLGTSSLLLALPVREGCTVVSETARRIVRRITMQASRKSWLTLHLAKSWTPDLPGKFQANQEV